MSILSEIKATFIPFVNSVSDMIGRVIFDYSGVRTSEMVNDIIFYIMLLFILVLLRLVMKRPESVYHYRHHS